MRRLLIFTALAFFIGLGCSEQVDGPEPLMDHGPDDLATDPSFLCDSQHSDAGTWVTLKGDAFSPLVVDAIASESDPDVELPVVRLTLRLDPTGEPVDGGETIELDSPLGTDDGDVRWLDDETLLFRVTDDLQLQPGVYDVEVENPNGQIAVEVEAFGVLPRPELTAAIPQMTCVAQGSRTVELEGENLLVGDDHQPTVSIDEQSYEIDSIDDCVDLHHVYASYQLCERAEFTVAEDSLAAGTHDVTFENPAPADCHSLPGEDQVTLTIADPPEVHHVDPSPICSEQLDYEELQIYGEGFITLQGGAQMPEVRLGDQSYTPHSAHGCSIIEEAPAMEAEECERLTISVAADDLAGEVDEGQFVTHVDVVVENPMPVGCHSEDETTVGLTPPPQITSVEPRVACNNDGTVTYDVEGDFLLEIDGEMAHILVDGQEYEATGVDCTDVDGEADVRGCAGLEVDIDLEQAGLEGELNMVAVNPAPANCISDDSEPFYAAGPPQITDAQPDGFCDDAAFDGQLELFGQFLYDPDGEMPVLEVGGEEVDFDLMGCSAAMEGYENLELCGGIDTNIPAALVDSLDGEEFDVVVTGTGAAACGSDTFTLYRTTPPTIHSVTPRRVCSDGSSFEVLGEDLHHEAQAYLDGVPADDVDVAADGQSATVTFAGGLSSGTAEFQFINPGDCGSEYEEEIRVTDGPLPIFVDPPVVFNQMNTQVTIYAAGLYDELGGSIDEVELIHPDGSTTILDFSTEAGRPHVVNAEIPADILAQVDAADMNEDGESADFGIRLTDQEITCSNEADALVTITDETTLALEAIFPPFGGQGETTAVEITASDDPDPGQVQFEATPRAYLNPTGSGDALGREIQALQFIDDTELNGLVPAGLSVGTYDLIVVNPEGQVGVLDDAFEVTEELPPRIESVSPSAWPTGTVSVDVEGSRFRDDPDDPEVEVFCRPTGEDSTDESDLDQPASITINSVSDSLIELTVDAGNLDRLSACYMRVTNPDGTFDEYSPITITNPAAKFLEFQSGPDLNTARRAPTTLSGSATRANHYVYAIGGDDGSTSGEFYATGEFARLDKFGAPGQWRYLPYELPEGRSFADGVRIRDFVYLVGGVTDDGVTGEILRAQVLDPSDVPEIVAVDIDVEQFLESDDPSDLGGLDAGTYYYRVSAVYGEDDPANPEGESLASEPQPIQLPIDGATVTIEWQPPSQINHQIEEYRIYRNVEPDDPYGDESYIATVDASENTFTDDGSLTPDEEQKPLPTGSLGTWHQVGELETERRSAGITFAPSPQFDDEYFIYAIGGENNDGDLLADYEVFSVDVFGERDQEVGPPMTGIDGDGNDLLLPEARTAHTAAVAYGRNASAVAGEAPSIFVYAGETDGGNATHLRVAYVDGDGFLNGWEELGPTRQMPGGQTSGHVGAIMNNNLVYAGGGSGGSAGSSGDHSEVQCGADCPPATIAVNFSNLSDLQMEPRAWMGAVPFRGFWYHTGGVDTGADPTPTVQFSVAGSTP